MAEATPEPNVYVRNLTSYPLYIRVNEKFRIRLNRRGVADDRGADVGLIPASLMDHPIVLQNLQFTIEQISAEEYQEIMGAVRSRRFGVPAQIANNPDLPKFGGVFKQQETVVAIEQPVAGHRHLDSDVKFVDPRRVAVPGSIPGETVSEAPAPGPGHALPDNAFPKLAE